MSDIKNTQENNKFAHNSRRIIRSLKAKANLKRSFSEKLADGMTSFFGSVPFLAANLVWFTIWISINLNFVPGIRPFDPFPFGLLTMVVSLEAIFLATIVLISQNRAAEVDDLREEIDLQVDMITEEELTKLMEVVSLIAKKNDIDLSNDRKLNEMLKPLEEEKIQKALEKQI